MIKRDRRPVAGADWPVGLFRNLSEYEAFTIAAHQARLGHFNKDHSEAPARLDPIAHIALHDAIKELREA